MTTKEKKESHVFIQIDNCRVVGYDERNVLVERNELTKDPRTKEEKYRWRVKGYYASIRQVLYGILNKEKEWLIDENAVSDLNSYLKQVEESNQKLLDALEG
ncbi:hypothetical protein [Oceanobacillus sp. FSL W7-1293]|uniref:Uncharacterized protein n=1 Tax=Oceanobacillus aidingensis TaxID=645964 RepID=A0ABV9JVD5_9BACI